MKAIRIHAYGPPEVLRYEDVPRPTAKAGEVLVRVRAAGVNPVDWKIRLGYLKGMVSYELPMIPGVDVSGTVETLGAGVSGFAAGHEVFGEADFRGRDGTYAEYVVITPDRLARKPTSLTHVQAASLPVVATTAWEALFGDGMIGLQSGQTVLVHAGAGGVGSVTIQLAKWCGARVIATASTANQQLLRELGADQAVDYTRTAFEEVVGRVDAVVDPVGGETQTRSRAVLKPGGTLAAVTGLVDGSPPTAGVRAVSVNGARSIPRLPQIASLAGRGVITPVVTQVFPLSEARRAHELSETGHARGKIVLEVAG